MSERRREFLGRRGADTASGLPAAASPAFAPGSARPGGAVVIAGLGNIGSFLPPLLARAAVRSILLIDRDRVEEHNLTTQNFDGFDGARGAVGALGSTIGRFKADVIADHLKQRFPRVAVESHVADVEDLPLGTFARADVVLGALDSRRARQALLVDAAWQLGLPAIDGAVGEGLLGRVQTFLPGDGNGCLLCTWGAEDFRLLAAEYPCAGASFTAPPSNSPAFAGAVVAGIMAAECLRLLEKDCRGEGGASREIAFDLGTRRFLPSRLRRSPACRSRHEVVREVVRLEVGFDAATVRDLLALLARRFGARAVELEFRRGLEGSSPLRGERFVAAASLRAEAGQPLADLGLQPADMVRAYNAEESVFVSLEGSSNRQVRQGSRRTGNGEIDE